MKLSTLFHQCAYDVQYQTVGHDVNYAFVESGDLLYIYFQGSSSTTDWIRNFLFPARPYRDMAIPYRVHRGFLAAWKEVEDLIITKILETNDNGYCWKQIVVVGYSHGGALATFCHECVWYYRPDLREYGLVGFGFEAPRIFFGWHLKKALRERWKNFRIIRNKNDIVTHVPPILFIYRHVAEILHIGKGVSTKNYHWPHCIGAHYPEAVYEGLLAYEERNKK